MVRFSADGSTLNYSTFLGGSRAEGANGIAVDSEGRTTIAGSTKSGNFPTTPGAFDGTYAGGTCGGWPDPIPCSDAFVARFSPDGGALDYSTFLGGSGSDSANAIGLNGAGDAYVTGGTTSGDFPTTSGAFDQSYDDRDAFIASIEADGSALRYSTFLGGASGEIAYAIAVDGEGRATVTGGTSSSDFPTTPGAFDQSHDGRYYKDAFVTRFTADGSTLVYSSFLGGAGNSHDVALAIAVDDEGRTTLTGGTNSDDFPTTSGAFDQWFNGGTPYYDAGADAFIARLRTYQPFVASGWTSIPPTIDGSLSEWAGLPPILLSRDTARHLLTLPPGSPPPTPADNSAELRALWTATDLYFAIIVRDDAIVNDSSDVWRDDEIELAFVEAWDPIPNNGDTHQYTVNADGRITDFGNPAIPPRSRPQLYR